MSPQELISILNDYKEGHLDIDGALSKLKDFPTADLGFAKLDTQRSLRTGFPEVIYCAGKTPEQVRSIVERLMVHQTPLLATRATQEHYECLRDISSELEYDPVARTIVLSRSKIKTEHTSETGFDIAVVTAGTSDIPVAAEAAVTAELFGNRVERIYDVGVAGIHRLFSRLETIRQARVVIAVAGMEGALVSVLGGLVNVPVIAVPTSVGYGASFHGLTALLSMLNSCSPGVSVVNIDNGFGAGYLASLMIRKSN